MEFYDFCTDREIIIEVTTIKQYQQNGAAEVMNRILMHKLHLILIKSNLDKR